MAHFNAVQFQTLSVLFIFTVLYKVVSAGEKQQLVLPYKNRLS